MKLLTLVILAVISISAAAFASETVKGAKKDFAAFKEEMNTKLDNTEKKLAELKAEAKAKGNAAHDKTIAELEAARDKLKAELNELKDDGSNKWQSFKKSFAESLDQLNTKVQKALKK